MHINQNIQHYKHEESTRHSTLIITSLVLARNQNLNSQLVKMRQFNSIFMTEHGDWIQYYAETQESNTKLCQNMVIGAPGCYQISIHFSDSNFLDIWTRLENSNTTKKFYRPQFHLSGILTTTETCRYDRDQFTYYSSHSE